MPARHGFDLDGFGYRVLQALSGVLMHYFDMARELGQHEVKARFPSGDPPSDSIRKFPMQCYALVILKSLKMMLDLHLDELPMELKQEVLDDAERLLLVAVERGAEPLANVEFWKGYRIVKDMIDNYDSKTGLILPYGKEFP